MPQWPDVGARVTVRYRRSPGSVPPLTDAVGHLLAIHPIVRVRTKTGAIVEFAPADVVALRVLTDTPVRTAHIRALEHAAAAAWPGIEQAWLDGWLLRAGHGAIYSANSAVPLDISAQTNTIPAIADWYLQRDLAPRLAIPDRLLQLPADLPSQRREHVWVRDVSVVPPTSPPEPGVALEQRPSDAWLQLYHRAVPIDVLTAVMGGELAFGINPGLAIGRAAVTDAPDGIRWVGLSAMRATDERHQKQLCEALLAWGASRGATRGYLRTHHADALPFAESLGFRLHHHSRYFPAAAR